MISTPVLLVLQNPPTNCCFNISLFIKQSGPGNTIYISNVSWGNAGQPIFSSVPNKTDIVNLMTHDGGVTWYGLMYGSGF
jgi:hypothetical protein